MRDNDEAWIEGIVIGRDKDKGRDHCIIVQEGAVLKRRGGVTRSVDARTDCEVRRDRSAKVLSRIEDLTAISSLHEPGLLQVLQERYRVDQIYTYTGKVLLAINPFKELDGVYDRDVAQLYIESGSGDDLPAHVFAVAR